MRIAKDVYWWPRGTIMGATMAVTLAGVVVLVLFLFVL
jgi:hypothetical protein